MNGTEGPGEVGREDRGIRPDIVIQGGTLLTMVEGQPPLTGARVLIQGDEIVGIRDSGGRPPPGTEFIDATHAIILPGLVNGHGHAAMTLFRGMADDLPLKQWLFERIFPAEARHLNPETVYWGALLGCLEMIASGITTFSDGYFFQDSTLRAVHQSGLRALVGQGIIDFPAPGIPDPKRNIEMGRAFLEKWRGFSDTITPGLFCHSPVTCSAETLLGAKEISRAYSLPLQIHLAETREEAEEVLGRTGRRPVVYLDGLGLLDRDLIAAHAVHLDEEEIHVLAARGAGVVHVPESNMKLASGVAKVTDFLEAGLRVGIGTDGCASNNNLDLFQEMDLAAKMAKVFSGDPTGLDAETVLRMATSWGAEVLGLGARVGTLEVGKKADIITVDINAPHLVPLYSPASSLVYSAAGGDVKDVLVNGRILMKDRAFQTLDPEEILARVTAISLEIRA